MNTLINKLVQFLRENSFYIDYDPDTEEKSHFSLSIRSTGSVIEYYVKVAEISWSTGKIILTFAPGTAASLTYSIMILIDRFDPKNYPD